MAAFSMSDQEKNGDEIHLMEEMTGKWVKMSTFWVKTQNSQMSAVKGKWSQGSAKVAIGFGWRQKIDKTGRSDTKWCTFEWTLSSDETK